jgi:hypothetical protein
VWSGVCNRTHWWQKKQRGTRRIGQQNYAGMAKKQGKRASAKKLFAKTLHQNY